MADTGAPTSAAVHALRRRAPIDYSLTRADFGGTPAWLKSTSVADAGALSPGRTGKENAAAKRGPGAHGAHAAGPSAPPPASKKPRHSVKAPAKSVAAAAAAAVPAAPAAHKPRAKPHGLEHSRAALVPAGGPPPGFPAPAARGGTASTSHSSGWDRKSGGRGKKARAVARSPSRGRAPATTDLYGAASDGVDYGAWDITSLPDAGAQRGVGRVRFAAPGGGDADAAVATADALRKLQVSGMAWGVKERMCRGWRHWERGRGRDGGARSRCARGARARLPAATRSKKLSHPSPPPPPHSTSSPSSKTSTAESRSTASLKWRSCWRSTIAR